MPSPVSTIEAPAAPVVSPITISSDTQATSLAVPITATSVSTVPAASKRKKVRQCSPTREILREIDIEGQTYRVPLDITTEAFHLVRNMVVKSLKAVVSDGGKASPYDLVLAYGPIVPLRTPTAHPDPTNFTPDSDSDQLVIVRPHKRLNRNVRSDASSSIITEPIVTQSIVKKGRINYKENAEIGDFTDLADAMAKTKPEM